MKSENKTSKARKWIISGALTVSVMALLPHIAKSTDVTDGMRIGSSATTNTLGSTSSVMIGANNSGAAPYSLAVGTQNNLGTADNGYGSIAVGTSNYLMGYNNFAFGGSNTVSGNHSMAVGQSNSVSAPYGLAYGFGNQVPATGARGFAGGTLNIAEGQNSVALGNYVVAKTYASVVIGRYNSTGTAENDAAAKNTWRSTDPLFVIGNGTSSVPANAMVVTKDGKVNIPGEVNLTGPVNLGGPTAAVSIKGAPNFTSDSLAMGASNKYWTNMVTSGNIMNVNHYAAYPGVSSDLQVKDSGTNMPLTGVRFHAHEANNASAIALYNLRNNSTLTSPGIMMHTYGLTPPDIKTYFEIRDNNNSDVSKNVAIRLSSGLPNGIMPDLGVGTLTPAAKLHVVGNGIVTGGLTTGSISTSGNASVTGKIIMGSAEISANASGLVISKPVILSGTAAGDIPMYTGL